jgi:hypothetical protein
MSGEGEGVAAPKRIQRKRTKGWRMPEGVVYIGRPTRWGNPFAVGDRLTFPYNETYGPLVTDRDTAVRIFWGYARIASGYADLVRADLAGRDLACWCPLDGQCHADVLLDLANNAVEMATSGPESGCPRRESNTRSSA